MNKTYSAICYIISGIIILILAFTLTSCSGLRHYKKVAKDTPRSEAKRNILAPVCAIEFPVKNSIDSIVVTEYKVDTSNENRLKQIIRQLSKQLEQRPECPQIDADSLYYEFKKSIKPDTIKITTKVKETLFDSAKFKILQNETDKHLQNAQLKYDELGIAYQKSEANFYKANARVKQLEAGTKNNIQLGKWFLKNNWYWLLIIAGLFLGYKWLDSKFTLPFKFGK